MGIAESISGTATKGYSCVEEFHTTLRFSGNLSRFCHYLTKEYEAGTGISALIAKANSIHPLYFFIVSVGDANEFEKNLYVPSGYFYTLYKCLKTYQADLSLPQPWDFEVTDDQFKELYEAGFLFTPMPDYFQHNFFWLYEETHDIPRDRFVRLNPAIFFGNALEPGSKQRGFHHFINPTVADRGLMQSYIKEAFRVYNGI